MDLNSGKPAGTGVLYYAMGDRFVREAIRSAESVRRCMPEVPIAIFTRDALPENPFDMTLPLPDDIEVKQGKMHALLNSPFEKTLFLDTDTLVAEPVWEVFELLDRFDLAACVTPFWRVGREKPRPTNEPRGIPVAFPKLNTGVLAFRRTGSVERLLRAWRDQHREDGGGQDQPSFRQVLYASDVRYAAMSSAYNFRLSYPAGIRGIVKIFHGRVADLESTCRRINAYENWRTAMPSRFLMNAIAFRLRSGWRRKQRDSQSRASASPR